MYKIPFFRLHQIPVPRWIVPAGEAPPEATQSRRACETTEGGCRASTRVSLVMIHRAEGTALVLHLFI